MATYRSKTTNNFQDCYGAWTELACFFDKEKFLQLQLLNKMAYKTTISRVQARFSLAKIFWHNVNESDENY